MNYEQLEETVAWLKSKGIVAPEIGIVLGTGLGDLANNIQAEKQFSYNVIPNFPIATVEFHFGKLIYGMLEGKRCWHVRVDFTTMKDMKWMKLLLRYES